MPAAQLLAVNGSGLLATLAVTIYEVSELICNSGIARA
jgi:hypothetical protein